MGPSTGSGAGVAGLSRTASVAERVRGMVVPVSVPELVEGQVVARVPFDRLRDRGGWVVENDVVRRACRRVVVPMSVAELVEGWFRFRSLSLSKGGWSLVCPSTGSGTGVAGLSRTASFTGRVDAWWFPCRSRSLSTQRGSGFGP